MTDDVDVRLRSIMGLFVTGKSLEHDWPRVGSCQIEKGSSVTERSLEHDWRHGGPCHGAAFHMAKEVTFS